MRFVVRPIELQDVPQCIKLRIDNLGSLIIGRLPPYEGYAEEQEHSMRKRLLNADGSSGHIHFMKVVDKDGDQSEVVAYARWEFYPKGLSERKTLFEQNHGNDSDKKVDEFWKLREEAVKYFKRCTENIQGCPHILLALLVTAKEHRRRGAGSLLVRAGTDAADKNGLPCYLEASEEGRSLYQHHGFIDMETTDFDLTQHGLTGVERVTQMVRQPVPKKSEMKPTPGILEREVTPGIVLCFAVMLFCIVFPLGLNPYTRY
ncbi:acyl-CoA N-acyltransferase [Lophiotrema nucula]|uniref:Acyl-CoA N-acyltransferase n=1 Tax=Lophiotrema nucula TaxID=690887 RepID=A0A6A5YQ97_9PLEO|nr:acyl-CoA N-acyltransferase [Lophiotrema nucula]